MAFCFPGEDPNYREARNKLLEAEMQLRKQLESVAALRRELPPGGRIPQDYVFDEDNGQVPLWNLFDLTPEGRGKQWYPKLRYHNLAFIS